MVRKTCALVVVIVSFMQGVLASGGITWLLDTSVVDGHALTARIETRAVPSLSHCTAACYDNPACVTVGYSPTGPSCQLYSADVTDYRRLIWQPDTAFYTSVCAGTDYTYVRSLGMCLKRHVTLRNFADARAECGVEGGDLLVVDTEARRLYLRELLHNVPDSIYYWVGATQTPGKGSDWAWVSGDKVTADNGWAFWLAGEPNHLHEECMEMRAFGNDIGFIDIDCSHETKFICEIPI